MKIRAKKKRKKLPLPDRAYRLKVAISTNIEDVVGEMVKSTQPEMSNPVACLIDHLPVCFYLFY